MCGMIILLHPWDMEKPHLVRFERAELLEGLTVEGGKEALQAEVLPRVSFRGT